MPPSRNIEKCERCRASQKYHRRPQYADFGRGEYCRYDRFQSSGEEAAPTIDQREILPTNIGKCSKPKPPPPLRRAKYDLAQDSGYDDSTSESAYLDESYLSMSAASTCSSEPSPMLKPQALPQPPKTNTVRRTIRRHDLEQRRQALRRTFQVCSQTEFEDVCCAISCVLNSARPLSRGELAAATTLYSLGRDWRSSMQDERWTQLDRWLRKCSPILVENSDDTISFPYSAAMETLLRNFSIQGIDTSHRTWGMICRNQIELSRHLLKDEKSRIDRPEITQAVQVMSQYVRDFGDHHLRTASLTSIILVEGIDSSGDMNDDFEMISSGTNQMSISQQKDDWVVLKQT